MCREIKLFLFSGFTERVREILLNYRWLGNICELKNVVECLVYCYGISDYLFDDIIIDFFKRRSFEDVIVVLEIISFLILSLDLREF